MVNQLQKYINDVALMLFLVYFNASNALKTD